MPMSGLQEVLDSFWITQKVMCDEESIERIAFENVEDAYLDVSNYGIMATIVGRGKWGK